MSLFRFGPGPAGMGGRGGDPIAPSDFSEIEKRTHEERDIFFYFAPQIF